VHLWLLRFASSFSCLSCLHAATVASSICCCFFLQTAAVVPFGRPPLLWYL
jgi:hypothetical protein